MLLKKRPTILTILMALLLMLGVATVEAQGETPAEVNWLAQYWNNVNLSGEVAVTRTETELNHDWGQGSPDPAVNADRFSARWTTSVNLLEEGTYRFTTVSDDGVRVWVGGEQLIDNWTVHAEEIDVATVLLDSGAYDVVVEYFENTGVANITFTWERLDAAADCGDTYVVESGDWLSRIARRCGVTVEALLAANPQITDPNAINAGQVLTIPGPDVTATTRFNLNFRPQPTTDSTPIDVIPAGVTVPVTGRNEAGDWLLVNYQDQRGWIAAWLTGVDGSLADVPVVPATDPIPVPPRDEEAILILEPGPGSRVTSPVRVAGIADPTQHQELIVRLLLADGTELAQAIARIDADLGQRGPYEVEVPFTVTGERQAFIQVLNRSARDGGITGLNSVGITIADSGPVEIVTVEPHPADITIYEPAPRATVSGGVATVSGFGLASFEQTLVVEIQDERGNVVGSEPVIVQGPGLGEPGPFTVDVPYSVTSAGPGRSAVRDVSPAFGGDAYVTTVEINLEP